MTLYDIKNDFGAFAQICFELQDKLEAEGREINDEERAMIAELYRENSINLETKLERTAQFMKNLEAEEKALDDEIKRLQKKKKSRENLRNTLKFNLDYVLKKLDIKKISAGIFNFRIQKNPPSLNFTQDKVPEEWLIPQEPKVDVAGIKQAIKDGATFDWCELVSSESLRIS
jgi:hypothetical protein